MEVKIYSAMEGVDRIDIKGHIFVVIDVLRASTTIICLMEKWANHVRVVGEPSEAYELKKHGYVLIGERGDTALPGFDFDNSPYQVIHHNWHGKKVAVTTTNGTRALIAVQDGFRVVIGGFRNIDAVCQYVQRFDLPVGLIPIGSLEEEGSKQRPEDELCAAAMLSIIRREPVNWKGIRENIIRSAAANICRRGEVYRRDVLLSVSPNETDIVPVLHDRLILGRNEKYE